MNGSLFAINGFSGFKVAPCNPLLRFDGLLHEANGDDTRETVHLWAPKLVMDFGASRKK